MARAPARRGRPGERAGARDPATEPRRWRVAARPKPPALPDPRRPRHAEARAEQASGAQVVAAEVLHQRGPPHLAAHRDRAPERHPQPAAEHRGRVHLPRDAGARRSIDARAAHGLQVVARRGEAEPDHRIELERGRLEAIERPSDDGEARGDVGVRGHHGPRGRVRLEVGRAPLAGDERVRGRRRGAGDLEREHVGGVNAEAPAEVRPRRAVRGGPDPDGEPGLDAGSGARVGRQRWGSVHESPEKDDVGPAYAAPRCASVVDASAGRHEHPAARSGGRARSGGDEGGRRPLAPPGPVDPARCVAPALQDRRPGPAPRPTGLSRPVAAAPWLAAPTSAARPGGARGPASARRDRP